MYDTTINIHICLYVTIRRHIDHFKKRNIERGILLPWIYVLFAAIVEVFWVLGLKYSETALQWSGTIVMIVLSFYFIIKACEELPAGTVYAVFTGSGAAVIAIIDFTMLGAIFSIGKALCIGIIIIGVIGIKMTTDERQPAEQGGT